MALGIAFYFNLPIAVISLCLLPFMIIGSSISHASRAGFTNKNPKAEADTLAADAIANAKTVASFGCDDQIVEKYD